MSARLHRLVREVTVVGAINGLAAAPAAVLHAMSVQLDRTTVVACSATTLLVLTILDVASARSHAREGALLSWPVFAILEALAVGAAASWWAVAS